MRRSLCVNGIKDTWEGLKEFMSFGKKEYLEAQQMKEQMRVQIEQVEKMKLELESTRKQELADVLRTIKTQVDTMGAHSKVQAEMLDRVKTMIPKEGFMTPDQLKQFMAEMEKMKIKSPDLSALLNSVKTKKD